MLNGLAKSRNLITGKSQSALETIRFIRSVRRSEKARSCFLDGGGEEESERAVRRGVPSFATRVRFREVIW